VGGFAASTYMRGIRLIHIPTSLLAQVDSAIGGKTAIDLPQGKNLVGAFYQPHLVVCDVNTLKTLPPADLSSQLAEVIKYGVIQRPALFSYLEKNMSRLLKKDLKALEHVVSESVQIKAQVVSQDERDHAVREILNYGHTFAHAFETLGRYRSLSHGQAVALGMVAAARVAVSLKLFSPQEESRQLFLIQKAGLPVNLARFSFRASQIVEVMKHDKKVKHGQIRLVLPQRIGQVIVRPVAPLIITHILKELTCG
jgi:3-dehydroquinate synthase